MGTKTNNNIRFMEQLRAVPENMKSLIDEGPLSGKGFTSINPSWRIQRLTEVFGPVGFGWWYEITDKRLEGDMNARSVRAFVDINLYVKDPASGEVSHAIPGTGGSDFVFQRWSGSQAEMSSECFKAALTDAISVAGKALGLGLDVYLDKDSTKYDTNGPGYVYDSGTEEGFKPEPEKETNKAGAKEQEQPVQKKPEEPEQQNVQEQPIAGQVELPAPEPQPAPQPAPQPDPKPEPEPEETIDPAEVERSLDFIVPAGQDKGKKLREVYEKPGYLDYFAGPRFKPGTRESCKEFQRLCALVLKAKQAS